MLFRKTEFHLYALFSLFKRIKFNRVFLIFQFSVVHDIGIRLYDLPVFIIVIHVDVVRLYRSICDLSKG